MPEMLALERLTQEDLEQEDLVREPWLNTRCHLFKNGKKFQIKTYITFPEICVKRKN